MGDCTKGLIVYNLKRSRTVHCTKESRMADYSKGLRTVYCTKGSIIAYYTKGLKTVYCTKGSGMVYERFIVQRG